MTTIGRKSPVFRLIALALMLAALLFVTGCRAKTDMPFNGEIAFHEIHLTIPSSYIRDSTQSTEDSWIFEKGFYSQYIMLVRKDLTGDAVSVLDSYAEYLREQGAASARTTFLGKEAVRSLADQNGTLWQEVLFAHDGSTYAIALRGGTEADFQVILDSIRMGNGD